MEKILAEIPVKWLHSSYLRNFGIDIAPYLPPRVDVIRLVQNEETLISRFDPVIVGDGSFYQELARFDWYYRESKAEFETARRLTQGRSICEVGCGRGAFQKVSMADAYVGIELNSQAVDEAKALGRNAVNRTVAEHLQAGHQGIYDVVCAFQVLEHAVDPDALVSEMCELLHPGGTLIVSVPDDHSFVGHTPYDLLNMPPHHQTRWTTEALTRLQARHDLRTIAIVSEQLDPIHLVPAKRVLFGCLLGSQLRSCQDRIYPGRGRRFLFRFSRKLHRLAPLKRFDSFLLTAMRGHSITGVYERH